MGPLTIRTPPPSDPHAIRMSLDQARRVMAAHAALTFWRRFLPKGLV